MESSVQPERQFSRASTSVVPHLLVVLMTSPEVIYVGGNVVGKEATTTGFNVGLPVGIDDVGFDVTGGDGATSALKQGPFWQPAPQ